MSLMMIRPMILMVLLFDNKGKPTKCEECLSFPWPWSPAAPSPGFSEPDVWSGPAGPTSTRINAWDSQAGSFQCHNGQTQSNLYLAKSLHPSVFSINSPNLSMFIIADILFEAFSIPLFWSGEGCGLGIWPPPHQTWQRCLARRPETSLW